jgi:hypothetical protein
MNSVGKQNICPIVPYVPSRQSNPNDFTPPPAESNGNLHCLDAAKIFLVDLLTTYPEAEQYIKSRVWDLRDQGYDVPHIERIVSEEMERMGPSILERRAERKRLINDPETRDSVEPPFTVAEQNLINALVGAESAKKEAERKVAEAERAAEEAEAKNKSGLRCWWDRVTGKKENKKK